MLELLIEKNLQSSSLVNFGKYENELHWSQHVFKNNAFEVTHDLNLFDDKQLPASVSATYSHEDYQKCAIDVVLETLFDDHRIHLTEKILRPIACGKPFLLVGTPGSLECIRSYGFETFDSLIDEKYDQIKDPVDRLEHITDVMKDIGRLSDHSKNLLYRDMHHIAQRNKQRFWSEEFTQEIIFEFKNNYEKAFAECQKHQNGKNWIEWRKLSSKHSQISREFMTTNNDSRSRKDILNLMLEIKKIKL
jgi:hypothetical protein